MPRDLTAANQARRRVAEDKRADYLRAGGWICFPPDHPEHHRVVDLYERTTR